MYGKGFYKVICMSFLVWSRQTCSFIDYLYIEIFLKTQKKTGFCTVSLLGEYMGENPLFIIVF